MVPSPCTGEPTLPTTRRNGCFNPFYLVVYPIYWGYWDFFRWYMCKIVCNKIGSSYLLRLLRQVIYLQDISLYTKLKKKTPLSACFTCLNPQGFDQMMRLALWSAWHIHVPPRPSGTTWRATDSWEVPTWSRWVLDPIHTFPTKKTQKLGITLRLEVLFKATLHALRKF